jgi:hypothetical protein
MQPLSYKALHDERLGDMTSVTGKVRCLKGYLMLSMAGETADTVLSTATRHLCIVEPR